MRRLFLLMAALLAVSITMGCGSGRGSSAQPPSSIVATPGDGVITVTWPMASGVDYWLFSAPSTGLSTSNWTTVAGSNVAINVASPYVATGLVNDTIYSFVVNARVKGGPAGSDSPSVSATPRLAGTASPILPTPWLAGAAPGPDELHGLVLGTVLVAVGARGAIYWSADGSAWTPANSGVGANLNAAAYVGGVYAASGDAGTMLYSTDAQNWTSQTSGTANNLNAMASNGGALVAVGAMGTILFSTDGRTWFAAANSATTNDLYAVIAYGRGLWIAAGAGGTLVYSFDANNWTTIPSNTSFDLTTVTFGTNTATGALTFVAMGAKGTLLTSPDARTWTAQPAISANSIASATFGTQFVAVGAGGTILTSTDGTTWAVQPSTTNSNLRSVAYAPLIYGYAAVGAAGTNLVAK